MITLVEPLSPELELILDELLDLLLPSRSVHACHRVVDVNVPIEPLPMRGFQELGDKALRPSLKRGGADATSEVGAS